MVGQGIGRLEHGPTDVFVLTRKINNYELIFNNSKNIDSYWDIGNGAKWTLSFVAGPVNECFVCQKYKYGIIFIDKRGANSDMKEIKDPKIIEKVV